MLTHVKFIDEGSSDLFGEADNDSRRIFMLFIEDEFLLRVLVARIQGEVNRETS